MRLVGLFSAIGLGTTAFEWTLSLCVMGCENNKQFCRLQQQQRLRNNNGCSSKQQQPKLTKHESDMRRETFPKNDP
jgi:hypothetical protein